VKASDILWHDEGLYQARYEKTASALIAIAHALERNRPLGGGEAEFLDLYQRIVAADAHHFTEVWRDPTAYYWVRLAYEFVGQCLTPAITSPLANAAAKAYGATDAASALQIHLGNFKRFVLALGVVARCDQHFSEPLKVSLPFAIPASRIVIDGDGELLIDALVDGHLETTRDRRKLELPLHPASVESITIRESPLAGADGFTVTLQPEAYNLAGLEIGAPLAHVAPSFQTERVGLVSRALELLHRYAAETFAHFRQIVRIIALKPTELGDYSNVSHSDLPGAFVITVANDPYFMADYFIHEFYHNRFFFVEERGAFFVLEQDNRIAFNEYYSPFRDDLRPLHGVFHGVYVYLAVWRFWYAVYREGRISGSLRDAVSDQIATIAIQTAIAVAQLKRFAQFSPFGAELFEAMAEESARIEAMTRELKLPSDILAMRCNDDGSFAPRTEEDGTPLSTRAAILQHAQSFDTHHQCPEVEAIVNATLPVR